MRALLEDELLRTVRRPDAAVLSELQELNDKLMVSIDAQGRGGGAAVQPGVPLRDFRPVAVGQMRKEVARLWQMTDIYTLPVAAPARGKKRIGAEHKAIIGALRKFDLDKLWRSAPRTGPAASNARLPAVTSNAGHASSLGRQGVRSRQEMACSGQLPIARSASALASPAGAGSRTIPYPSSFTSNRSGFDQRGSGRGPGNGRCQ